MRNRQAHHFRSKPSGFTLIELLVVITIIALMVAILLPSLSNAREAAKRAVCLTKMRQIYYTIEYYRDDYKLWYPPNTLTDSLYWPNPPQYRFGTLIRPYLNAPSVAFGSTSSRDKNPLMCPANPWTRGMTLAQARVTGYDYGNYWISARFGFDPSSTNYGPKREPAGNPNRVVLLGETRGVTYTRFGHANSFNTAYLHPDATMHLMVADGQIRQTKATNVAGLTADGMEWGGN